MASQQEKEQTQGKTAPSLFAVPPVAGFLEVLAERLLADPSLGGHLGTTRLEELLIFLPTRRAVDMLGDYLLRQSGREALLLPELRPLGDEEATELLAPQGGLDAPLPQAADEIERHLVLAAMIHAGRRQEAFGGQGWPGAGLLAQALAQKFDEVQRHRGDLAQLEAMDVGGLASHWEKNLALLKTISRLWPEQLAARGKMDPIARRNAILAAQTKTLEASGRPVLVAGSTGTNDAVACLMKVVAHKHNGAVIFPAFDFGLTPEDWEVLGPTHPQAQVKQTLAKIGASPKQVLPLPDTQKEPQGEASKRMAFLRAMFCPPERAQAVREESMAGAQNMELVEAASSEEEARVIALLLRDHSASSTSGEAVLATADRILAERVEAELARFGLKADNAAGQPLARSPVFVFLRLLAQAACEDFSPASFLSLAKHPLSAAGLSRNRFRQQIRQLERKVLRDELPPAGLEAIAKRVEAGEFAQKDLLSALIERITQAVSPLREVMQQKQAGLEALVRAHILAGEALAARDDRKGFACLWAGKRDEADFFTALLEHGDIAESINVGDYPAMLDVLARGGKVRQGGRETSPIRIWGMLEARLLAPALLVVGGLTEQRLPAIEKGDPWLNRAMRKHIGLPPQEASIGQQAHDFLQCQAAKNLWLTYARHGAEGAPLTPSRWLLRAAPLGLKMGEAGKAVLQRARSLDPAGAKRRSQPPAITPPVALRPKKLSASALGELARNPYAFYARRILCLKALTELGAPPSPALLGTRLHDILEAYAKDWPYADAAAIHSKLMQLGESMLLHLAPDARTKILWRARLERAASAMARLEASFPSKGANLFAELDGSIELIAGDARFSLSARADRIDRLPDGTVRLLDYKSGAIPSKKAIAAGLAPQLPLIALIAQQGGYQALGKVEKIACLAHINIKAARDKKVLDLAAKDGREAAVQLEAILRRFLADYLDPDWQFIFREQQASGHDYDHLARRGEWGMGDA